jgi:hypothetical protein
MGWFDEKTRGRKSREAVCLTFQGLVFGYAKAAMFFGYGVTLFYGGVLVLDDCLPYEVGLFLV